MYKINIPSFFYIHCVSKNVVSNFCNNFIKMYFLNFYVLHGSAAKFLKVGEKYYVFCRQFIFVSNSERIFKIG